MSHLRLIEAIKSRNSIQVEEEIQSGADINQQDEYGWTPLNWAAGRGDQKFVNLLLEKGADVLKVGRDRRTPYKIALAAGHAEVAKLLREAEDKLGEEKIERPTRIYCKAYRLTDLRQFHGWTDIGTSAPQEESGSGRQAEGQDEAMSDDGVVFLHEDYTVTKSVWPGENLVFDQVTPEWKVFCTDVLNFKVPDDLDLVVQTSTGPIHAHNPAL
jgi:uncharacterized protein